MCLEVELHMISLRILARILILALTASRLVSLTIRIFTNAEILILCSKEI